MAKSTEEVVEMIKVRCLVNLKYDTEIKTIGEDLEIRKTDLEEMVEKALVEVIE